ncbi:LacI family DNA-binding transcriptional regulator [Diplocloster agilis]|uniref:LacI family DNA-binding transcriptional regulator n=1 Tax=Diplocloster agilis TaxID=2850323 RepID=UPI000822E8A1|nr:LacI family DNA-binding transcriptional regulator [Suonthocola fibrivorans]MCU6733878.1 LacI family transcriptional regulator [Suonthocola fibrivorans]SCJ13684.1 HTH-type transcriptional repressor CytR [uncultured Clostridium sp.]
MATIFDVARRAGVSKSTVSRVLNHPDSVKEKTRTAIERAIRELNYTPSYFAQGIRTGKTKTIAMLVPEYSNMFYSEMFRGVEDTALAHGYMVLVCNTERHSNSEEEYIEELLRRNVDGIIYNTYQINEKTIRYLQEISDKIPVVFMDRIFQKNAEISYVLTDGYNSTRKAVHYLFERGKRKIGYIRNTEDIAVIEERYQGYLQGLKDCGLPVKQEFIYRIEHEHEPDYIRLGRRAAKHYLKLSRRPDAIMAAIDTIAIGCLLQLRREGVQIPEEINVVGYDNISLSELIEPSLTTIAQPIRKLGQKAGEIVIAKINGEEIDHQVMYDGELVIRDTTN